MKAISIVTVILGIALIGLQVYAATEQWRSRTLIANGAIRNRLFKDFATIQAMRMPFFLSVVGMFLIKETAS